MSLAVEPDVRVCDATLAVALSTSANHRVDPDVCTEFIDLLPAVGVSAVDLGLPVGPSIDTQLYHRLLRHISSTNSQLTVYVPGLATSEGQFRNIVSLAYKYESLNLRAALYVPTDPRVLRARGLNKNLVADQVEFHIRRASWANVDPAVFVETPIHGNIQMRTTEAVLSRSVKFGNNEIWFVDKHRTPSALYDSFDTINHFRGDAPSIQIGIMAVGPHASETTAEAIRYGAEFVYVVGRSPRSPRFLETQALPVRQGNFRASHYVELSSHLVTCK